MGSRPDWSQTWMSIADIIGKRSKCSRAQIGAVIVSKNERIVATGYNGAAATFPEKSLNILKSDIDTGTCLDWCPRARGEAPLDNMYDACPAIHAEANALLYVDRSQVEGGTIYITDVACMQCAKLVSNSGVTTVVMRVSSTAAHRKPEATIEYLRKCKINVVIVED